ncbi:MAG: TolC family protein [Burkholderiales bacterium]|nr:TolC family protein [Burkholderiales bacterium]
MNPFVARTAPALVLTLACLWPAAARAERCVDENRFDRGAAPAAAAAPATAATPVASDPRTMLAGLVHDAIERSHAVGAARLLADAAQDDIAGERAARAVHANFGAGFGPAGTTSLGTTATSLAQANASVTVSQLLWDGGRTARLVDWRAQLAQSAQFGQLSLQEQLALTTVALAIDRSRWRMTAQVWGDDVRKMGCLVDALQDIVRTDRGRASELVQAQKSLQQAELAQAQTQSMVRQVEIRLRRLVGDGLPPAEGLATAFNGIPELQQLVADADRGADVAELGAQAAAARRYAEAVEAGTRPQVSWNLSGATAAGAGGNVGSVHSSSYAVGLTVNIPLLDPGAEPAIGAARKRAQAAALQRADLIEAKRFRIAEVYEQTMDSMDRARRVAEVLRNSELVRSYTLQQWQQMGKRSLFDVMAAESDHYAMRVAYVNALYDVQQLDANLLSLGRGVLDWLR